MRILTKITAAQVHYILYTAHTIQYTNTNSQPDYYNHSDLLRKTTTSSYYKDKVKRLHILYICKRTIIYIHMHTYVRKCMHVHTAYV